MAGAMACQSSAPPIKVDRFHRADRITAAAYPDADAVVLLNRFQAQMGFSTAKNRPYAHVVHVQRIQVLNAAGLKYAKQTVSFDDFSRILNVQGRVYKENGNIIEMDPSHYRDVPFFAKEDPALSIYSQKGLRVFKVPEVEVGDVIEVATLRVYRDARWLQPLQCDGRLPVVRTEVALDAPNDFDLDFRVIKGGEVQKVSPQNFPNRWQDHHGVEIEGRRRTLLMENKAPIFFEENQAPLSFLQTQVFISLRNYMFQGKSYRGFWSFEDVEKWFYALTQSQQKEDQRLTDAVQKALGAGRSKTEVINFVQRFLQDRVRDVPSYSHLGVFKGRTPWDIWRFQIGDSKDQAILGQHMLRAMGYQSLLVLVADDNSSGQITDLPSPAPYNHVLIAVPEGGAYTFIDPEGQYLPRGRLSPAVQGKQGLLLGVKPVSFIVLPQEKPSDNQVNMEFNFRLQPSAHGVGNIRLELSGQPAAQLRSTLYGSQDNWEKAIAGWLWPQQTPRAKLDAVQVIHLSEPDKPLVITGSIGEMLLGAPNNGGLNLKKAPLVSRPWGWAWRQKRQTAAQLGYPMGVSIKTFFTLPQGWGVMTMPSNWEMKSFAFETSASWFLADGRLEHQLKWATTAMNISPQRYGEAIIPAGVLNQRLKEVVPLGLGGDRGENYQGAPF